MLALLFGQNNANQFTFKNAVAQYNYGNFEEAEFVLNNLPNSQSKLFQEDIQLLLMRIKYRLSNFELSKNIGASILYTNPKSKYKSDILLTFGDIFLSEGNANAAFRTYIKVLKFRKNSTNNDIVERIFQALQFGIATQTIDELLLIETNPETIQLLQLAKAHTELQNGRPNTAESTLKKNNRRSIPKVIEKYYDLLEDKLKSHSLEVKIVAVILPLSGKDRKIGRDFLAGLQYAESNENSSNFEISLVIHDNESNAVKTMEICEQIANNPKIVAVIGPISTTNSILASGLIKESGVPILLPTVTNSDVGKFSENIFQLNSDLKTRGELAGKIAVESLYANNIAVLAPADEFGKELVGSFTSALARYSKTPVAVEWYSGTPINLERQFKSLRNHAWELHDNYSSEDLENIQISPTKLLRSIDVIYMPIHPYHLDYIGAQFPAYNFDTIVLGHDNWTDLTTLRKENIGPHFNGMVVVTNYNDYEINSLNINYGSQNSTSYYQAIDSYNLLTFALNESARNNDTLINTLSAIDRFDGVFGTYSFSNPNNNINSNLQIIQFDGYNFDDYFTTFQQ